MKILIINSSTLPYPASKGGAVENLIDMYVKDNEKNKKHDITIYSIYDKEAYKMEANYKRCTFIHINTDSIVYKIKKIFRVIARKAKRKYFANEYINKIFKDLKNNISQYDLVIIENVPEFGLIIKKLKPKRLVLHLHNDILNPDTKQAKEILNSYDEVWCLSKYVMHQVEKIENTSKAKLLYNGIDFNSFNIIVDEHKNKQLRKKFNIRDNDIVLMYSGRLVPEKGILELINAFCEIRNDKLKLLIVGSNSYAKSKKTSYVKKLFEISNNFKNKIIFTGYVDYKEMPYIYQIADVGIVPTICEEGFALTVVEFLASGKPLIVTNSGAIPELVNDNVAITIEKNDKIVNNLNKAILKYIEEKEKYKRENSINIAKKYTQEKYCKKFEELVGKKEDEEE